MNISDAIRQLALRGCEMYLTVCTVDYVDEDARTIDCTPINEGAPLLGVNLQADQNQTDGVVIFPAVGSYVIVGFISPAVAVVLLTTDVTKVRIVVGNTTITAEDGMLSIAANGTTLDLDKSGVVYNNGSETMANATKLQEELIKMSTRIDTIIQAIATSPVGTADGGALYKTGMSEIVSSLIKEDFSEIIDNKIKH